MSMKRSKQRSYGRGTDEHTTFSFDKHEPEPEKTWEEHMEGQDEGAFQPYSLQASFAKGTLIAHSKFGKGVVVSVEGARIDVLFADGKKKLAHRPG